LIKLDILSVTCKYLDFRDLLTWNIICKDFKIISEREVLRRKNVIKETGEFYSDKDRWYLGKKCPGFNLLEEFKINMKYPCEKWEELCTLGEHGICRSCRKKRMSEVRRIRQEQMGLMERKHNENLVFWNNVSKRNRTKTRNKFNPKNE